MPREKIAPHADNGADGPDGGYRIVDPEVHVGWLKDLASVQIGLEIPPQPQHKDHPAEQVIERLYGGRAEAIGRDLWERANGKQIVDLRTGENLADMPSLLEAIEAAQDSETMNETCEALGWMVIEMVAGREEAFTGLWTNLDRKAINDLIRLLRKARDGAFGRDE